MLSNKLKRVIITLNKVDPLLFFLVVDTFIIEPLYSLLEDLFPIFKYKDPDQSDTITTILILIYNLLVTTDCDGIVLILLMISRVVQVWSL